MKRFAIATVLALALCAFSQNQASANGGFGLGNFGFDLTGGISFRWLQNIVGGGGGGGGMQQVPAQLGPWYSYWPYEAHFQTPALPQYPYWPTQTMPNGQTYMGPGSPGH